MVAWLLGSHRVCVSQIATSVACRGLDVKDLVLVINYNCPNHLEDYVQRIGRTGRAGRKGTAYTFVTPEEAEYTPDIVKALTDAKQEVPAPLQQLADEHLAKVASGDAKKRRSGYKTSGGFKFDDTEDLEVQTLKKLRVRCRECVFVGGGACACASLIHVGALSQGKQMEVAAGVSDESELAEAVAALRKAREGKEKGKGGKVSKEAEEAAEAARKKAVAENTFVPPPGATPAQIVVLKAQWEAGRRAKELREGPSPGTAAGGMGAVDIASMSAEEKARFLASRLSKQLTAPDRASATAAVMGDGEEKEKHFMDELEINDYPQQARWKATNRETMNRIQEWYGAAATNRGVYVAPGRKPGPGERKLYLVIEATSAVNLQKAKVRGQLAVQRWCGVGGRSRVSSGGTGRDHACIGGDDSVHGFRQGHVRQVQGRVGVVALHRLGWKKKNKQNKENKCRARGSQKAIDS